MAYHWEHIKGINGTTPTYTYINFTSASTNPTNPTLQVGVDETSLTDCGTIVSTNVENKFLQANYLLATTYFDENKKSNIAFDNNNLIYTTIGQHQFAGSGFTFTTSSGKTISFVDNIQTNSDIKIGSSGDDGAIFLSASNGSCTAKYFNATSDKRAKENLTAVSSGALDFINGLQVYTFNYKNNTERTIGLIAQDLVNRPFDQVSFVSNPNATGINSDYMSIKEDKLIYVLLQAVQEQQQEIKELKEKLIKMENNYGK